MHCEVMTTKKHFGHYFKTLHFIMEQIMNRQMEELDLTASQGHIIGFLGHRPEAPCARDMEVFFDLSHATVSGLLSRMEAKGFVEIRPDEKDRRVKRIYLLEKGRACSERIEECVRDNETRMVEGFTPQEQELFRDFLQRVTLNLSQKDQKNSNHREE